MKISSFYKKKWPSNVKSQTQHSNKISDDSTSGNTLRYLTTYSADLPNQAKCLEYLKSSHWMSVVCASAHQVDKICRQLDAVCKLALTKIIKSSGELFSWNINCDSPVRFYEFLVLFINILSSIRQKLYCISNCLARDLNVKKTSCF